MKKIKYLILISAISLISNAGADAAGTSGGRILKINTFARSAALAGAYGARADVGSVSSNPAALARIYGSETVFSHSFYYLDTSLTSAAAAWKWGNLGMGLEWKQLFSPETFRDQWGHSKQSFNNRFTQFTAAAAMPLSRRVSAGLGAVSLSETLYENTASAFSFDAALYIIGFRGDTFGFKIKNIGTEITHISGGSRPDAGLSVSGAHRMGEFILSWEALHSGELDFGWRSGLEAGVAGIILRGGVSYEHRIDFSMGLGIPYRVWVFDYAFSPHPDLGGAHRMSLGGPFLKTF